MTARATWTGFLKISLVTIPIRVYPATEATEGLSFNQLHAVCQTRVQQRKWCPTCVREVSSPEIVKGFEFERGRYVVLSDSDVETVRPESTRVIDLVQFADAAALDPLYIDRTYYLAPNGPSGEAFAVIRDGMTGRIGVGKLALYGREYLVAVRPRRRSLLLHTLHHAAQIRDLDAIEADLEAPTVVDLAQVRLARQVMAAFHAPLDLATYADEFQAGLRALIDAKIAGKEIVVPPIGGPPLLGTLREALHQSLEAVTAAQRKRIPAKVKPAAAAAKRKGA